MRVDPAAAQAQLPKGWTLHPWTKGAWAGANLMLIFSDAHGVFDAERKAVRDAGFLRLWVITWGHSDAVKWRIFVTHDFATDGIASGRGTDRTIVQIRRRMSRESIGSDHPRITETWQVESDAGRLSFDLTYDAVRARFSKQTARVTNPKQPEGPRQIRRIEQLSYMIYGQNGVDTVANVELANTIPELAPLLDGSEEILAIRILPVKKTESFDP